MPKKTRLLRLEGDIAYVTLTKGYEAVIDLVDVGLVGRYNWQAHVDKNTVYAIRSDYERGYKRTLSMHRMIMGEPDEFHVDHADADGLNNRRNNLRKVTVSQNMHNQQLRSNNTSGFKGVSWNRESLKWQAHITFHRHKIFLGYFLYPEAAHYAYCEASKLLHGSFGRTK